MLTGHRLIQTWSRQVDTYIALTEFAKKMFISGGLPAKKIAVKPNFVFSREYSPYQESGRQYFLHVGRLCSEKGTPCLLDAWQIARVDAPLDIVGTGPLFEQLGQSNSQAKVRFLGQLERLRVFELMAGAFCVIFPSQVYEGMPRVIIEAFSCGVPVIGSKLGSTAEIIRDHVTGLHFEAGNAADLAAKVEWAWTHPGEMARMGQAARAEYEAKYTPEINYKLLIDIYRRAMNSEKDPVAVRTIAADTRGN
jgi:glycosyltransferase involved in cell wall biosynthesis